MIVSMRTSLRWGGDRRIDHAAAARSTHRLIVLVA
jgi:hypothetical protein